MKYVYRTFLPFFAGGLCMAHVTKLYGYSPYFRASWWWIGLAAVLGLVALPYLSRFER